MSDHDQSSSDKPTGKRGGKPTDKVEKLAQDAVDAGKPILESDVGRKAVDVADSVFETAGDLADKALGTEVGRKVTEKVDQLAAKAIESEAGRKALDSEAGQTARKVWNTSIGRNVGTGAAVGAGLGLFILNPWLGAAIGGGLGYLRTLAKKK